MNLIPEWRKALKLFSVQANAIGAAMGATYLSMYDKLKADLPPKYMIAVTVGVFVAGIVCRVISQQPKEENATADR